ncbi:MAG: hydroxyethylthiazole kinase, partial [Pseudomonadota bacterium]
MQVFSHTLALALVKLRKSKPQVQCISNLVALDFVYNVMLVLGTMPAIVHASEEIADFSKIAQSLMINTGTLSGRGALAMLEAASLAQAKQVPWVLDPNGVGQADFRDKTIFELLTFGPSVIRAKAREVMMMAHHFGYESRINETARTSEDNVEAARYLANKTSAVIVMTGPTDIITDHENTLRIANGHPLMSKVAGIGCALSATIAAFCAIEENSMLAAVIAVGIYDIIGEIVG